MSQIIEDEIFIFKKPDKPFPIPTTNPNAPSEKKFLYQNQLNAKSFQALAFYTFKESNRTVKRLVIPFRKRLFDLIDVWYSAKLNEQFLYEEEKIIIALRDLPYQIQHYKKKLQAMRQISTGKQGQPKFVKMYITKQGIIELIIPKLVLNENVVNSFRYNYKNLSKAHAFTAYVENIVKFCINDAKITIKNIFKALTTEKIQEQYFLKQSDKQKDAKETKFDLFRYLARSSIQLRFDCTESSALYEQVVDITLTEVKEIEKRINIMRQANKFQLNTLKLYFETECIFNGKQMQAFYITAKEKQITKNLLEIPQVLPTKQANNPNSAILENKYMFNNIVMELPMQNQKLILLGESGFGKIEYGMFNFWYNMNLKLDQHEIDESFKQSNMIKNKYLVVKSPKVGNDRETVCRYKAKQMHELQIINKLKGISCALIPRFYKVDIFYPEPYSQIHKEYISKYDNALLSELTSCYGQPGYNLGNVSEQSWETLTLKKIIYIMSQIAQGLRCLHINKIIHLDMKPENVLFLKSFMIKIIDFGEAYHPQVPYRDSTPAYSYPYGCPQIAQELQAFSGKCDVFSFGMILYELIYGKDLIQTHPSRLLREYRTLSFGKRLIFNAEQMENYGQKFVLPMLNHLIIKSLSPDIEARPSMTWISVLLKKFLEVLP